MSCRKINYFPNCICDNCKVSQHVCVRSQRSMDESNFDTNSMSLKDAPERSHQWPEDAENLSWSYRLFLAWTYAYMSPLLVKGARQHKDGVRLVQEDLFEVPEAMKSESLSTQFRYVSMVKCEVCFNRFDTWYSLLPP